LRCSSNWSEPAVNVAPQPASSATVRPVIAAASARLAGPWYDLLDKLHEELGLKPWQWLCLPRNPYPPGTAASRNWRPDPDGEDQALWLLLDEARRCQLQHQSG
jgi:hypothetical protein